MLSRLMIVASNAVFASAACVLVVACFVVVERSAAAGHDYYYAIRCDNMRPCCACPLGACGTAVDRQCSTINANRCLCMTVVVCQCKASIVPIAC